MLRELIIRTDSLFINLNETNGEYLFKNTPGGLEIHGSPYDLENQKFQKECTEKLIEQVNKGNILSSDLKILSNLFKDESGI